MVLIEKAIYDYKTTWIYIQIIRALYSDNYFS